MTRIEIRYVDKQKDMDYHIKDDPIYVEKYFLHDNCIQFNITEGCEVIIPFDNVLSIKVWEESDKVNESKNKRH